MNLSQFFEHWSIAENPFKGEEARDDSVFARLGLAGPEGPVSAHSDLEKVLGSLARPATAVVFGEKGSGKTAIKMQIVDHARRHNAANPEGGVWVIAYDDLNGVLDCLHEHGGKRDAGDSLRGIRLVDHIDALLGRGVTALVDGLLVGSRERSPCPVPPDGIKRLRRAGAEALRDARILQAVYDESEHAGRRARLLRRRFRVWPRWSAMLLAGLAWVGWLVPGAVGYWACMHFEEGTDLRRVLQIVALILTAAWIAVAAKHFVLDRWRLGRIGRRLSKQLRVGRRGERALAASVGLLAREDQSPLVLPLTDSDEIRYEMLDRLRRVLDVLGYSGVLVLVDRVDEPTLVNGDPERMRSIVWPMFNNKFLQQEGLGVKMLLPIELRHALFKESSAFFQEARLDKQNLVERLSWTGSMLYDLCDARLRACRPADAEPIGLLDLFDEDVTGRDVVDALDQMHQPRDAFKLLYRCLSEHCSNVTAEQGQWRVPRLVLEQVRKQESERVQQLYRGIRPA